MGRYQLHLLDTQDRVTKVTEIEAASDHEAVEAAARHSLDHDVELWSDFRKLVRISCLTQH